MLATYIASDLNQRLPEGYFAEPNVQFGIEIDVATLKNAQEGIVQFPTALTQHGRPCPIQTVSFQPTSETVEVSIFSSEAGQPGGAIELVSPANKDRSSIAVRCCETYLQQDQGLVVVDVVTVRPIYTMSC